jgi:hypothetical protein
MNLDHGQTALMQQVDGKRSLGKITAHMATKQLFQHLQPVEFQHYVKQQFQTFWQLDFLAMGLPPTAT